ncbi:MAG: iron-only hydrogenase system regulator [Oscillibacter sp.]|jgi:iron complex transport system ATP-binding protein|nr:iron-only hydrogenase system regulator [Oscillibacter sp.]
MESRVAVIAMVLQSPAAAEQLNELLHQYGDCIVGRMGIPYRERGLHLISVFIDAPGDVISALSGKLGRLPGVTAKTVYAPADCGKNRSEGESV